MTSTVATGLTLATVAAGLNAGHSSGPCLRRGCTSGRDPVSVPADRVAVVTPYMSVTAGFVTSHMSSPGHSGSGETCLTLPRLSTQAPVRTAWGMNT